MDANCKMTRHGFGALHRIGCFVSIGVATVEVMVWIYQMPVLKCFTYNVYVQICSRTAYREPRT